MNHLVYFDTSALAKWYINEAGSDDVEKYIQDYGPVQISDLTIVEMRSLISRIRREKTIEPEMETKIFATFEEDIRLKHLIRHPFPADIALGAVNLISLLPDLPLRTLDAMHLAIAKEIGADTLATSDKIMALAAQAMDFSLVKFH
jgi:predicted nucleic acid-binding protein